MKYFKNTRQGKVLAPRLLMLRHFLVSILMFGLALYISYISVICMIVFSAFFAKGFKVYQDIYKNSASS